MNREVLRKYPIAGFFSGLLFKKNFVKVTLPNFLPGSFLLREEVNKMAVETAVPEVVRQVREEAKELQSRKERARDLWHQAKDLLKEKTRASELRSPEGIMARLGRGKPIPVLRETFGEGEESVEVEISPRMWDYFGAYHPYLEEAAIRIQVGRRLYWLPPQEVSFGRRYLLPESEELGLLEELMTAIEKKREVRSGGLIY